jgi:hypothetical protein
MSQHLEELLTVGLREHVAGLDTHPDGPRPSPDLLDRATASYRRHRQRRHALVAASAVGAVTAASLVGIRWQGWTAGAGDLAGATRSPAGLVVSSPLQATTPKLQLIAAVEQTRRTSYRITLTNTRTRHQPGQPDLVDVVRFVGTYDPTRRRGSGTATFTNQGDTSAPAGTQVLVVDGTVYLQDRDDDGHVFWVRTDESLSNALTINGSRDLGATDLFTVDPGDLLPSLRALGQPSLRRHSGTAPDADADTYTYAQRIRSKVVPDGHDAVDEVPAHTIVSTVQVDPGSGRVVSFAQETTLRGAEPQIADRDPITFRTTAEFSAYGTAVDVQAPPADLVRVLPQHEAP